MGGQFKVPEQFVRVLELSFSLPEAFRWGLCCRAPRENVRVPSMSNLIFPGVVYGGRFWGDDCVGWVVAGVGAGSGVGRGEGRYGRCFLFFYFFSRFLRNRHFSLDRGWMKNRLGDGFCFVIIFHHFAFF